jgi:hypothetical protein
MVGNRVHAAARSPDRRRLSLYKGLKMLMVEIFTVYKLFVARFKSRFRLVMQGLMSCHRRAWPCFKLRRIFAYFEVVIWAQHQRVQV